MAHLALALTAFLLFRSVHLTFFAPVIVAIFLNKPFGFAMRCSLLCGLAIGLFSTAYPLGFYGILYAMALLLIVPFKNFFFSDRMLSLTIYTALFSFFVTLLEFVILTIFFDGLAFSWRGILSEFIIMPLLDGFYAFFWFTGPLYLIHIMKKKRIAHGS